MIYNNNKKKKNTHTKIKQIKAGTKTNKTGTKTIKAGSKKKKIKKTDDLPPPPLTHENIISWILIAIRTTLGYADVRSTIITHFANFIPNQTDITTFDGIISYNTKEEYDRNKTNKLNKIYRYLNKIQKKKGFVVFSASNIENYSRFTKKKDDVTHYQTFICDNTNKTLYCIDPALLPDNTYGIYHPFIAIETIIPYFSDIPYNTEFIRLTYPAQDNFSDVFCQSWSLYILIIVLRKTKKMMGYGNNNYNFNNITIEIPESQDERYNILLNFLKAVMTIPFVRDVFIETYQAEILRYKEDERLLTINPYNYLNNMTMNDMYD